MKKVLVICKETGQTKSFKRVAEDYNVKNNIPFEWTYADDRTYLGSLEGADAVMISPEVMLNQDKIEADLKERNIPYFVVKPMDYGIKRMDRIIPSLLPLLGE